MKGSMEKGVRGGIRFAPHKQNTIVGEPTSPRNQGCHAGDRLPAVMRGRTRAGRGEGRTTARDDFP